jgi:hypothetical protein
MTGILGRKRNSSAPPKPRAPRASRPPRQQELAPLTLNPLKTWRTFGQNTLLWARWWLENGGELPASCHPFITDRLAPWIAAVVAGGPETRAALLDAVAPIRSPAAEPTRTWIMSSPRRDRFVPAIDLSQIRPAELLGFSGVNQPDFDIPVFLHGNRPREACLEGAPRKSASSPLSAAKVVTNVMHFDVARLRQLYRTLLSCSPDRSKRRAPRRTPVTGLPSAR